MYLNEKKLNRILLFSKIRIGIFSFFAFIFLFSIYGAFTDEPQLKDGLWLYLSLALFFIFLVYRDIVKFNLMRAAMMYNGIFILDFDGYISLNELAVKTEKNEKKVSKEIKKLIEKHIFQNISLEFGEKPQVILMKKVEKNETITESVDCPYCGATVLKRKGFSSKCEFCGNDIM
ncbi:MAG: hypothetical protein Q4A58_02550 [Fusobacterium sp.]|uniref:hypothetical protein n=1 Tax=Fusobacterium sp. TaxID=68766 RepID=UPI0026DB44EB|nr:hypothetical protein [Fusobacterium sp.]MDO4690156.1 hypothetical protein [Fusobacterium sp.]